MAELIKVNKEEYENMKETLEILSNPKLLKDISKGVEDICKGRTISLDKYLKSKSL